MNQNLFFALASGKLQPDTFRWSKKSYRLKFILRSIFLYPITFSWLRKLEQYRNLSTYLTHQGTLPTKLQRPYLSVSLSKKEQYKALIFHYQFMESLPLTLINQMYQKNRTLLMTLMGKNEQTLSLFIHSENKYGREGEFTLYLTNEECQTVGTLTFSVIENNTKPTLFIGGLQGADNHIQDAKSIIQKATKTAFGLFPKRMLLETALTIAQVWNIENVIAVSNKSHIFNRFFARKTLKKLRADYDSFWLEINGKRLKNGLFSLPLTIERKSLEDISSKKRSEYRQRYVLLDDLHTKVTDFFSIK